MSSLWLHLNSSHAHLMPNLIQTNHKLTFDSYTIDLHNMCILCVQNSYMTQNKYQSTPTTPPHTCYVFYTNMVLFIPSFVVLAEHCTLNPLYWWFSTQATIRPWFCKFYNTTRTIYPYLSSFSFGWDLFEIHQNFTQPHWYVQQGQTKPCFFPFFCAHACSKPNKHTNKLHLHLILET